MIQMAAALCSVINGGSYYEPHVMRQIMNEQGSVVETKDPVLVRETVSSSTSEFLKEAMFQTVENGTGGAAKVAGYHVGGKTGTAEKQPRSAKNYLLSQALLLQRIRSFLSMLWWMYPIILRVPSRLTAPLPAAFSPKLWQRPFHI